MGRSSRRRESTAVLCCALILLASPSQARKKAATLDDRSDACRACKRIVMNVENSILPTAKQNQKEGAPKQSLNVGALEHHISEKLADVCTFSSIYTHKPFFRECENIMEEYEEGVVAAVLEYVKRKASFNLVTKVCHKVTSVCPKTTNSTESEVVKLKDKYMSERPHGDQKKGGLIHIVAADWMERVINSTDDVVVFHYSQRHSFVQSKIQKSLEAVASKIGHCAGLTIGTINLGLNEIPPPYGDYIAEGGNSLCNWRFAERLHPRFLKDLKEGDITVYDLLDFVYNSVSIPAVFKCISEVSGSVSREELSQLRNSDKSEL
mmetsp:Transcript_53036/g.77734  ORF Transcript_53036/g.77734 Transcript_53036/m.77734 type:complete len:322 (-) Transcript_53036:199-1164(-)